METVSSQQGNVCGFSIDVCFDNIFYDISRFRELVDLLSFSQLFCGDTVVGQSRALTS